MNGRSDLHSTLVEMVWYFRMFLDSGIYTRASNQIALNDTINREREAKVGDDEKFRSFRVVRLSDNIQTVFIVLFTCLASCLGLAIFEYLKFNRINLVNWVKSSWAKFMKTMKTMKFMSRTKISYKVRLQKIRICGGTAHGVRVIWIVYPRPNIVGCR